MNARSKLPVGSRLRRGFTLIELLVALSGGLFVSVVVFTLARDASRFYQREGRAANATLAALAGFERLRIDLARAGFLSTPNVQTDPFVCSRPGASAPVLLRQLAAVRILNEGSPGNSVLTANSLKPDALLLAGAYSSADEFSVRAILPNADSSAVVQLNPASPAMYRLGYVQSATPELKTERLRSVFAPRRAVRIVDRQGNQHYGLIETVTSGANGAEPQLKLSAAVPLRFRPSETSRLCGIPGLGTGSTINVVNFIRYEVKKLVDDGEDGPYASLFSARAGAYGEDERTELVRAELDPSDTSGTALFSLEEDTPGVEELVAEYAVDFELEPTAVTGGSTSDPQVSHLASSDAAFATYTGATGSAERIRSVRVRLGVRSREADRTENVPAAAAAPGLYRLRLGTEGGEQRYARVRTFQADVALNNQLGANW